VELTYDKESFLDRVFRKSKSQRSRRNAELALAKFDKFCLDKFARPSEQIVIDVKDGRLDAYRTLDNFIGYMDKTNINPNSMSTYISWVKSYMVYSDIDISPYKFKQRVALPTKRIVRDAELNREQINRILSILPLKLRIFCMMVMTTLRRPNEISHLRVRDINFDSYPVMITIPSALSKNRVEGTTFTTKETADLIRDHIRRNKLGIDAYIFGKAPINNTPAEQANCLFRYHLRNYPDLNIKLEGSNRYAIHIYSFKKFGYTRVDRKFGKNFSFSCKSSNSTVILSQTSCSHYTCKLLCC